MKPFKILFPLLLLALLLQCAAPRYDLGIAVGTLIDGTGDQPQHDVVVLVRGKTIEAIVPKGELNARQVRKLIDASNKTLIPGLFDMHGHVTMTRREASMEQGRPKFAAIYRRDVAEWMLRQLLFYGITTIREAADDLQEGVKLKQDLMAGAIPGPRMFACGPLIEAEPAYVITQNLSTIVSNEEEVRTEVRRQALAGVDFVKIYASLPPDLAQAVMEEAHTQDVCVLGHLGETTWKQAVQMGIDGIVHGHNVTPEDILTGDQYLQVKDLPVPMNYMMSYQIFDPATEPAQELFRMMRQGGVANDPTLVVFRNYLLADTAFIAEEQGTELKAVPPFMMEGWKQELSSLGYGSIPREQWQGALKAVMRFVKAEYDNGVFLLAGSDFANPNVIPGLSLHQELELLVEAGIPPEAVLKMATHDAARWLGILAEAGTVEAGKQADLVILEGDPLEDIRNTRQIFAVVQGGEVVDREGLR